MKIPRQAVSSGRYGEGSSLVNTLAKRALRNRSTVLSNAQHHVVRQMGIRVDKNTTEKEAVMLVKRVVDFNSAYKDKNYVSPWSRKRKKPKPTRISARQHMTNVLMHREENGSKRAVKQLAKL